MKKLKVLTLSLIVLMLMSVTALAESPIKLFIGGQQVVSDVDPIILNGRTLVPIRVITEHMPANIDWIQETRQVFVRKDGYEIIMEIGSRDVTASFDYGTHYEYESFTLEQAPILRNGRTLVPIRFISERLNQSVRWDGSTRSVHIGEVLGQFTEEKYFGFDKNTGTITSYSFDGPKEVNIPPAIQGIKVKHIGDGVFERRGLDHVSLPDGLVSVGNRSFASNNLFILNIPSSVNSIGEGAFQLNKIEELTIPRSVKHMGREAFTQNKLLEVYILRNVGSEENFNNAFDYSVRKRYMH